MRCSRKHPALPTVSSPRLATGGQNGKIWYLTDITGCDAKPGSNRNCRYRPVGESCPPAIALRGRRLIRENLCCWIVQVLYAALENPVHGFRYHIGVQQDHSNKAASMPERSRLKDRPSRSVSFQADRSRSPGRGRSAGNRPRCRILRASASALVPWIRAWVLSAR